MEKLIHYGWKNYISKANYQVNQIDVNTVGRVISIRGNTFEIVTDRGMVAAELLGKILFAFEKWEQPKVGDWIKYIDYGDMALIEGVLPRFNQLYRKKSGREVTKQVMVANIDQAIIIQGMDHDFNINRIERYIVQAITCNIEPVIILNKQDLVDHVSFYVGKIEKLQRQLTVHCCSVKTGQGIDEIKQNVFTPESTSVLIGSSGVGKSSIVNALLNSNRKTQEISQSTGKGKHTTTTRDLFLLDNGAIVIDTPGMREFGIGFEEEASFDEQFPVISQFAEGCKYRDCMHTEEEGCHVIQAVNTGEIEAVVYESYLKLIKEQKRFQTTTHEKKKQGKQFGKMAREAQAYRKKYKY
ncbi:MAG: ribosome small subunit-dependent GTPase A [Candidatus Cyclobacteriaceae bacterium M3_2C_046]